MRLVTIALIVLIGWVQAELWFGKAGVAHVHAHLAEDRPQRQHERDDLDPRDVDAPGGERRHEQRVGEGEQGLEMVEEKARSELGMVKPDEILVVLTPGK